MSLTLGKQFDRNYTIRIPFLDTFYNIQVFFSKKSSLVLYNIENNNKSNNLVNIKMFKNLSGSIFSETFLELHNYKKKNLDIVNQFHNIKGEFTSDVLFICNESINLAKVDVIDRTLYDTITIYGFSLSDFINEYVFILTERQHINQNLEKKVVRTVGLEIGSTDSINYIKELNFNIKNKGTFGIDDKKYNRSNLTIKL